jgi:hypothetical protein
VSLLGAHRDEFAERNLFGYALLGLLAYAGRAQGFIERHLLAPAGARGAGAPDSAPDCAAPDGPDRGLTAAYAVLGVLVLARRIDSVAARWLAEVPEAAAVRKPHSAGEPTRAEPRSLLR